MEWFEVLRSLRKEKNITQSEMAKNLKLSQKVISNWEKGTSKPNIEQVKTLSDYFKVTADYIIGRYK